LVGNRRSNKQQGGKTSSFPPTVSIGHRPLLSFSPTHPPPPRGAGGRPGPPGPSRLPGSAGSVRSSTRPRPAVPVSLVGPSQQVSSQDRPPRPPRVGQVTFVSSLDTIEISCLTDSNKVAIVNYGGRSHTRLQTEVGATTASPLPMPGEGRTVAFVFQASPPVPLSLKTTLTKSCPGRAAGGVPPWDPQDVR
jgi:hypothetical protein